MSSTTTAPAKPERRETIKERTARERIIRDREARAKAAQDKPEDLVDFELPEVEIVRKELAKEIVGLTVEHAEAASMKCLRSYFYRKTFTERIIGLQIQSVKRVGLYITIELSNESILVMSLGASGSPRRGDYESEPPDDAEITISLDDGSQLWFVDPVGTGQVFLVQADAMEIQLPETVSYGHDPLKQVAWPQMREWLFYQDAELKSLLTNDRFLVGIGDIYADEILFSASLRYDRPANGLNTREVRRLHRALGTTLFDAMKYGGASVSSRPFISPFGNEGVYGSHLKVWGRHRQLSDRSRTPIKRTRYAGTWTYYCDTQV